MSDHLKMPVHEQWTCGHVATAMCSECHQELVQRANALAAQKEDLRDKLAIQYGMHPGGDLAKAAEAKIKGLEAEIERLRERLAACEIYLAEWDRDCRASYWAIYGVPAPEQKGPPWTSGT